MAYFLLLCSHTRSPDEINDALSSYAWCDRCNNWQPVTALVTAPPAQKSDALDEAAHQDPVVDPPAAAASTGMTVPGPHLDETWGTAGIESRTGVEGAEFPASSTRHTTG